jgi:hypothetical protein
MPVMINDSVVLKFLFRQKRIDSVLIAVKPPEKKFWLNSNKFYRFTKAGKDPSYLSLIQFQIEKLIGIKLSIALHPILKQF